MTQVSYTRSRKVGLDSAVTKKVGKVPFGSYKNVTPKVRTVKIPKNGFAGPGNINEAPGYSKLKKTLGKKGLQTNYR